MESASPGSADVPPFDLGRFATRPLQGRAHLVDLRNFATPIEPGATVGAFLDSLPDVLGASNLRRLAEAIVRARAAERGVLVGLGGHVIKVGLGPLLVDLARRRLITGFVLNGAAAIHDAEVALCGTTSEDVGGGLFEGTYGNASETGALFARAAARGARTGSGLGRALGEELSSLAPANAAFSVLCAARELDLPVTVHVAIGTDTVHMHPDCDGAALGACTHGDFLRLATLVEALHEGVYVNIGSAVLLPEVFLKAVAIVHNARAAEGSPARVRITTGNLDMLRHYRPRVNVLERPAEQGFDVAGQHELVVPLLRLWILKLIRDEQ